MSPPGRPRRAAERAGGERPRASTRGPAGHWLRRHVSSRTAYGLALTTGLILIGLFAWVFGAVVEDATAREPLVFAPSVSETIAPMIRKAPRPKVARHAPSLAPRPALLSGMAVLASLLWLAFASPGIALAARELHLRIPGFAPSQGNVSLGVKVDDPATAAALERLASRERVPITIFATSLGAKGLHAAPNIEFGVAEEPSGDGLPALSERHQDRSIASAIQRYTGTTPDYFLAAPRTDLAALADAPANTKLVMPEWAGSGRVRAGLLVLNASGLGPEAARDQFLRTLQKVRHGGLRCVTLSRL